MSTNNFNTDFAKEFMQGCTVYSAIEEYRLGNLLFMQFAGNALEMCSIALPVVNKIFHSKLISQLEIILENENIPQIESLNATANNLLFEFRTYVQNEPYTSHYYNELIAVLGSFQELCNSLNNDVQGKVSKKIKNINKDIYAPESDVCIDSSYFSSIIDNIESYLNNILAYYNHFMIVWHQENDNNNHKSKEIGLTTQVADHLWELISEIEAVSTGIENLLNMLLTWEVRMEMNEEQALNN